jgi:hypothetical protein
VPTFRARSRCNNFQRRSRTKLSLPHHTLRISPKVFRFHLSKPKSPIRQSLSTLGQFMIFFVFFMILTGALLTALFFYQRVK